MNSQTHSATIRVACVDDHPHVIESLAATFAGTPDIRCVGRLATADGLVDVIRQSKADVVILDIVMPGTDPFEMLKEAVRECPNVRTIVFSGHIRERHIDAAIEAGAWGFVDKSDSPEALLDAIRGVVRGEFVLSPSINVHGRMGQAIEGKPLPTARPRGEDPVRAAKRSTPEQRGA